MRKYCVNGDTNLKDTMHIIDKNGIGTAFIIDEDEKFLGAITDSDIRRIILEGYSLSTEVSTVMNENPITLTKDWTKADIMSLLSHNNIRGKLPIKIPVLDNKKIIDILYLDEYGHCDSIISRTKPRPVNKVLIVGGAGYVGNVLTKKLLRRGYSVRVFDNLLYGDSGIKNLYHHKNFEFLHGDIRNITKLTKAIKNVDAVIHLAAIVGDPASALNPEETIQSNYIATKTLAELCKYSQINRFIFASTCSVYGASEHGKELTEKSKLNPVSLYAEMKLRSEEALLDMCDGNFSPTILRKGTLHGISDRMRFDLVVNTLTIKALKDKKFTIFGGEQYRAFCSVSDAVDAYIICLEAPIEKVNDTFNVSSENISIIDVGKRIKNKIPEAKMEVDETKTDKRDYIVSNKKFCKTFKINLPTEPIEHTITNIKNMYTSGMWRDYPHPKYSNYKYLKEQ